MSIRVFGRFGEVPPGARQFSLDLPSGSAMIPPMDRMCQLCRGPAVRDDCYVRLESGDHPACRACWEQLFLDPRRVLRTLQSPPLDRTPPPFHPVRS